MGLSCLKVLTCNQQVPFLAERNEKPLFVMIMESLGEQLLFWSKLTKMVLMVTCKESTAQDNNVGFVD